MAPLPDSPTTGAWAMTGSPLVVAQLATSGFDWVCLDAQHGAFGRTEVLQALRAATPSWSPIAVRVPANDAAEIGFALDAGATTVIVPMVDSADDAAAAVAAVRYPPLGRRSWGPLAPLWGGTAPTPAEANDAVACWVMIETAQALAAIDEIASVPGVDGVFIGPFDLAIALGTTVDALLDATDPAAPLPGIVAAATRRGVTLGAFGGTPGNAARLRALGFVHVVIASDSALLGMGIQQVLGGDRAAAY